VEYTWHETDRKTTATLVGSLFDLVYLMHHYIHTPIAGTCVTRVVYPTVSVSPRKSPQHQQLRADKLQLIISGTESQRWSVK